MTSQIDSVQSRPSTLTELFMSFTVLALQGFGGVLAVIQRELVERKQWLTQDEFVEDWAIAQTMPGPSVINMSMIVGGRYFGLPGAMAALSGMLLLPLIIVLMLALAYGSFADSARLTGALHGMAAVSAGMIAATGMKMAGALKKHPLPLLVTAGITALGVLSIAFMHWPMIHTLIILGGIGCLLTYRRLRS